ncbi:polysaccharide biosynthesis tyrosine autokinase [Maribacter sp. SA7]|uniref:GumC family protein n=1 Tax=Maribacter zhoushanensis TaxID=3030012 RepID=UPI0023EBE15D|nr:tyrosine-protein kinase [Maribacter zhoushanensis]MDF4201834.1 polysaccharide biosynthesis tyrosine autokinase [Maribacter zhoushanensis]
MSEFQTTNNRQQNLFHIILQKFLPFWPLFLALSVMGLIVAQFYIWNTVPKFESTGALIVNDEKKGVDQSQLIESFNVFESKKIVENEIEVIKSKDVVEDVVNTLGLYSKIYTSGFFRDKVYFEDAPIKIILMDPSDVKLNVDIDEVEFSVDYEQGLVFIDGGGVPFDTWVSNPFGGSVLKFLPNGYQKYHIDKVFKFQISPPRVIVNQMVANLYVGAASKSATVVRIEYSDPIPERGNAIVNQLIESYKKATVTSQNSLASNTLSFIDERMEVVGKDLQEVEKDLEKYRSKEGVINLGEQGNLYLQNVGDYDRQIGEIDLQLSVLNKIERYVISKNNNAGIVPSTLGVNDPILGQLLQKLYDAEIEYGELSKTTAENNPLLTVVKNRIENIRPSILENVRSQKSNLLASKSSLSTNSGKYNEALNILPEQERIFLEINRRKKSIEDLYDFLVQKREETALSYAPTLGNVRVIEKAEASLRPVSPKKAVIYLIGLLMPLGLGLVIIASRELLNTKVLFRTDLEINPAVPVLGELAYVDKSNEELLVSQHKDLFIVDQFRRVLTDMQLYDEGETLRAVMITSSIAGEGKSYVSSNLAITLALSGKKTALVDLDLRKAGVSHLFGLENEIGMSQVLKGDLPLKVGIANVENLTIFPAGEKTLNSSNLLTGEKLKVFVQDLKKEYEAIIFDTPPTTLVSDAAILSKLVDKTIIVIRHNHTPKFVLQHIDENVLRKGFENSELIFNGVKMRGLVNNGYGYGYGYEVPVENNKNHFIELLIENFKTIKRILSKWVK